MLEYLKQATNVTSTENGALTYASSGSDCLDLFATVGALRSASEDEIRARFDRAWAEDRTLALRTAFYARDVRGGLGERRAFRVILRHLANLAPETVKRYLALLPEFGRWDDVVCLLGTPCEAEAVALIRKQLAEDAAALRENKPVSLCAKWLPSANASKPETVALAKRLVRLLGTNERDYRKLLVALRRQIRILENNLRERDYSFDYAKQPSNAMLKYRKAFWRNDAERYGAFLEDVAAGRTTLHTGTLAPYELVQPCIDGAFYSCGALHTHMRELTPEEQKTLNTTWEALPDYACAGNALAVVDTSGSMYNSHRPMPAAVALSLGLYLAERNKGLFHNHFIEFSGTPMLVEIKGETFCDRLRYVASFNKIANTNVAAVFNLILMTALSNGLPQSAMPERLIFISDMEFDVGADGANLTNFEQAKQNYARAGYRLPEVVFWNVESRNRQQPVKKNERGVTLVSGCTPRIFSMLLEGRLNPYEYMIVTLNGECYAGFEA